MAGHPILEQSREGSVNENRAERGVLMGTENKAEKGVLIKTGWGEEY